ncbi:hypothetical protein FNV43_RR00453 [Rhamnella rubrinervis]|uniref:DDE Tnp4 domain-containing protein n=1 Tax=Rhamnella rubrinervis TaxID=2594499 RepID=A0A8K0MR66_9ROSA|nr:hypothetical protein FNV43_RR00453 [Rhamnella rubrinervis]
MLESLNQKMSALVKEPFSSLAKGRLSSYIKAPLDQNVEGLDSLADGYINVGTKASLGQTAEGCLNVVTKASFSQITEGLDNLTKWLGYLGGLKLFGSIRWNIYKVHVSNIDKPRYRKRKGEIATNVLGVCNRDMKFIFVLSGLEGSALDSRVLRDVISRPHGLRVPNGCYYLVNAGYTNGEGFLTPYKATRYYLSDWREGCAPMNYQKYFNMKHACVRNNATRECVEVDSDKTWITYVQNRAIGIGSQTPTDVAEDLNMDIGQDEDTNFFNTNINSPMSVNQASTPDTTLPTQSSGRKIKHVTKNDLANELSEGAFVFKQLVKKFKRNATNYPKYLAKELDRL